MQKNILLIMERDNFQRDSHFIRELATSVASIDYEMRWYNPLGVGAALSLDPEGKLARFPYLVEKLIKGFMLLWRPWRWKYYIGPRVTREKTISGRIENLRRYIRRLPKGTNVVVLSRSSGGRIASIVADDVGIQKMICISYPFKHPDHAVEPERFEHLASLKTPFLIIQGTRDPYGGREVESTYVLSRAVHLTFVETNHDFAVTKEAWESVVRDIKNFIA